MIDLGDGMTSGQAKEERRLEDFQRTFKHLDEWAKELRSSIKAGDLQGVKDCTAQLMVETEKLIEKGAFKDEDKS